MPNDCWNHISVKATHDQIRRILAEDLQGVPEWNLRVRQVGRGALIFNLWSPNVPAEAFVRTLLDKYEGIWVKNEWDEEGGTAGVIVGTKDAVSQLTWNEGCIEEWDHRLRDADTV
jgi:hypothetical protein